MKETTLEQFVRDARQFIETAQTERVLVTRDGEPFAIVVGVRHKDEEDLRLEAAPWFWQMISESRRSPTVKLKDVEAELFADEPGLSPKGEE